LSAERVRNAFIECGDIFVGESVVQRQHGLVVHHRPEAARGLAADTLGRRIRRDQIRVLGLDLFQLLEELVVLRIRQVRLVEYVVRVVRAFEFRAQPHGTFRRSAGCRVWDASSGHAIGRFAGEIRLQIIAGTVCRGHWPDSQFRVPSHPLQAATLPGDAGVIREA
jgi:hypothetical protein